MMVPEVSTKDKITIGENFKRESGNPIYIPHCCAVSCGLPTRLVTPWKIAVRSGQSLLCRKTGIYYSIRNSMPSISTSWSRFQGPFSCLHSPFLLFMLWGTGKVTLVCMFPCFAACLGYSSIHLKTSVTIYMPLSLWGTFVSSQLNWPPYRLHTAVLWPRSIVQFGHVNHRPSFKRSWIIPFLPQFLLRFSSRSCSLWCLQCQHSCNLLQIPWSFDSTSPPLRIKLCY